MADASRVFSEDSILDLARDLLVLASPADIMRRTCIEAQRWTSAAIVYGSAQVPGQSWELGAHVCTRGAAELPRTAQSAMFAVHRRLVAERKRVLLDATGDDAPLLQRLSVGTPLQAIVALPAQGRRGVVTADLALGFTSASAAQHCLTLPLEKLAVLTASALENAHRLLAARRDQERLLLLAEATDEARWDWTLDSDEFWWGSGIHNLVSGGVRVARKWPEAKFGVIHPDDAHRVHASFQEALASTHSAWRAEYRLPRPDGGSITVEDRAFFLRASDNRAYRVIGALRDITPVKELLLREQQARGEAEAANRTKDEFLAMLGHELRNPLSPIVSALHIMRERGDLHARELMIIERQAQHLVRLVDDLLDVSRIVRGALELTRVHIELHEVVASAVEMVGPLIAQRGHTLHVTVAEHGLPIDADPARLSQVVSNLLTNAARYTEAGGHIHVTGREEGGEVVLRVRDSGIGIAPEMLGRVFDMFVQARQDSDRSAGGLGLGLSIVRNLMALHGGKVEVHSEGRGRGSQFTVRLPFAQGPARAAVRSERASSPAAPLQIMVVDDNEDAAELLAAALERMGHAVRVANDGAAALAALDASLPDVMLLDIGLPGIDGYEIARRVRARFAHSALTLVAVTGYGQAADKSRAHQAGFDEHLVKPVDIAKLRDLLAIRKTTAAIS